MSFTLVQQGSQNFGTGSIQVNLPTSTTSVGTILIVTLAINDPNAVVTAPAIVNTSGTVNGWQLSKSVTTTGGLLQQWHFADNPGGLYAPGSGPTFTCTPATDQMRGAISEFNPPLASSMVILETLGSNSGTGALNNGSMSTIVGGFTGSLGIISMAEFFTGTNPPNSNPTFPSGYSSVGGLHSGSPVWWNHGWNPGITNGGNPAGGQSLTGFGWPFTGQSGTTIQGWASIVCVYRSVVAAPINVCGGEGVQCLDIDPTGQVIYVGGDVEGNWRTVNFGDDWIPSCYGLNSSEDICAADTKFSLIEPGKLYMCGGKTNSGAGGFYSSPDGGCTLNLIAPSLQYWGNATPTPPRLQGQAQENTRTANQLIAQDTTNNLLYTVTANKGVMRSADFGSTWVTIGFSENAATPWYPRCIVLNPNNPTEGWVGMWDIGTGQGGIWHCTTMNTIPGGTTGSTGWTQLGGYQSTVSQMVVVGAGTGNGYLYAVLDTAGIARWPLAGGANLTQVNGSTPTAVDNSGASWWGSIAGVTHGADHVITIACSEGQKLTGNSNYTNVVQLTFPSGNTPANWVDLTGPSTIHKDVTQPFGMPWFKNGASWQFWLGGNNSCVPHLVLDPNDPLNSIYIVNSGGFWRTHDNGGHWALAVNNMPMLSGHGFAIDPTNGSHFITIGDDFNSIDITDPTGNNNTISPTVQLTNPGSVAGAGGHRECHGIACDPVDGRVYAGMNISYSAPSGGEVAYRAPGNVTSWTSLNLNSAAVLGNLTGAAAPAVIGVFAGRDASNARYVLACCQNSGTYRYSFTTGKWSKTSNLDNSANPGAGNALGQAVTFTAGNNPSIVYLYDRHVGIYRSNDYGSSWTLLWSKQLTNKQCGWMDVDPNQGGNLWVGTDDGLWLIQGASAGTVGGSGSGNPTATNVGTIFNGGCAGVTFSPAGALYAMALPGTGVAQPVTTLYVNQSPGNSTASGNFTDATGGDFSIASMGVPGWQLGISSTGWLWGANQERLGFYIQLTSSSNLASLSGTGNLTANPQITGRGTAALSGTGTLIAVGHTAQSFQGSGVGTLTATGSKSGAFAGVAPLNGLGVMNATPGLVAAATSLPVYLPGQPILYTDVNEWFTWEIIYTTGTVGRTTTVLTPDSTLTLPIIPGASYEVRQVIFFDGPSGANFQFNWAFPSDANLIMESTYWSGSNVLSIFTFPGNTPQYAETVGGAGQKECIHSLGTLQTALQSGNLTLQWAQKFANNTPVTLLPFSFLMMRRIQ